MSKLEFWYPAKPFVVTQAWGIYNPAYEQFGFNKHNGVDFLLGKDKKLYAPIDNLKVVETGNIPTGSGIFARMITQDKYLVGGADCYVEVMFMHCEQLHVKRGDIVNVGNLVATADNTGFSTGPHTHMLCRRLSSPVSDTETTRLDIDPTSNYTFDPAPYFNKFHAVDSGLVLSTYKLLIQLLQNLINVLK